MVIFIPASLQMFRVKSKLHKKRISFSHELFLSYRYMIEFDDGAKRYVRAHDLILQSYLDPNQNVRAQTQDGYFDTGIIKRLIKKRKTGNLGYIVEKNGEEKWYPLRFISLTVEQAEHLPTVNNNTEGNQL
jgi:hypothetical protein